MAMKELLSRSTSLLEGLKDVLLVVPGTLTRRLVNSWLAVDDHEIETFAKKQAHKANRDHIRFVCVLDDHTLLASRCQTTSLPRLLLSSCAYDAKNPLYACLTR